MPRRPKPSASPAAALARLKLRREALALARDAREDAAARKRAKVSANNAADRGRMDAERDLIRRAHVAAAARRTAGGLAVEARLAARDEAAMREALRRAGIDDRVMDAGE